jgi:outer membrane protein assembly factor BamD
MKLAPVASRFCRVSRPLLPALAICLSLLAGCGGGQNAAEQQAAAAAAADKPVDELYNAAQDLLNDGNPRDAAKAFEEVDRQHPYSQWATRAQMMTAFAYYEANQYDEAVTAAQRFIELHPGHKDVPYAYYLVGLSQYEQISDVGRDQEMTRKAMESFQELIRRFPESDYARDARLKVDLANDHIAGKEMEIGRYYQSRRQWLAAVNRFRTVAEKHQTTTHVPEALHRLVECYLGLGLPEEAQRAAAWLGHNFPGNAWYQRSYALLQGQNLEPASGSGGTGSWFSRLF